MYCERPVSFGIGGKKAKKSRLNDKIKGVSGDSISPLVAKSPPAVWFKHQHYHQQPQQHPKWLLNCRTSNLATAAQQLTVLIDSIGSCIPDSVATPETNIARITTAADSRNTTISTTTKLSATAVPDTTTEQDMSRESRHVHVIGLPDSLSDERVSSFFSTFTICNLDLVLVVHRMSYFVDKWTWKNGYRSHLKYVTLYDLLIAALFMITVNWTPRCKLLVNSNGYDMWDIP
uniref:RRM domain-containing protein n=1 Tax=Elaeophora elaphi TaxID=1147741 RepID=A0A0R3S5L6_9BILA